MSKKLGLSETEIKKFIGERGGKTAGSQAGAISKKSLNIPFLWIWPFIFALILRIIYFFQIQNTPLTNGSFILDASYYIQCAVKIVEGDLFFKDSVFGSPFYPFFVSFFLFLSKRHIEAVQIAQILMDAFNCISIYFISLRLFNKKSGAFLASLLYAGYGLAIFFSGLVLDTTLITTLYLGLFWVLLGADKKPGIIYWAFAGILCGVILAVKTNILLFIPCLIFWIGYKNKENGDPASLFKKITVMAVGVLIVLLPFAARNQVLENRFSPFPAHGGLNFYIGNHPGATGKYAHLEGITDEPITQIRDSIAKASIESGKKLTAGEASGYWLSKAQKFMADRPGEYLALLFKKILIFWNYEEAPSNTNFDFCKNFSALLKGPVIPFGLIAPFALFGIFMAFRQRSPDVLLTLSWILSYMLSVVLLFVSDRYRFPVIPFLLLFASLGILELYERIKSRAANKIIFSLVFLGISFLLVYQKPSLTQTDHSSADHNNLGNIYMDQGKFKEAVLEYKEAIRLNPNFSVAYFNLANSYDDMGDIRQAVDNYRKAIEMDPDYADAHYNLGLLYKKSGSIDDAMKEYLITLKINPLYAKAHYSLGNVYKERGLFDKATQEYKKTLEIDPAHEKARAALRLLTNKA